MMFPGLLKAWGIWLATGIGLAGYGALAVLDATHGTLRGAVTPSTIGWYSVAFAGFLIALWWNRSHPIPLVWLWAIPIVFRLIMLSTSPTLSDDVYRYIWDGHVSTSGINPYAYALDSPKLDSIHIPARDLANNPTLGTPYLPAAQAVFAAGSALGPSEPITLQVMMMAFDLGTAYVIVRLLALAGLSRDRVMLYLWNPIVIVEISHGAHLEAMMVFGALLAVFLALRDGSRWWMSPVVLALATLTKPIPILLITVLWHRWSRRGRGLFGVALFAMLVPFAAGAGWGLGPNAVTGFFGSARVYSEWMFNGGISYWLSRLAGDDLARLLIAGGMLGLLAVVWRRSRHATSPKDLLSWMSIPLMAYVLLTWIMHPWYLLSVVVFTPFMAPRARRFVVAAWLYLSWALALSYLTYQNPLDHAEVVWVRYVVWLPTLVLLAISVISSGRRRADELSGVER